MHFSGGIDTLIPTHFYSLLGIRSTAKLKDPNALLASFRSILPSISSTRRLHVRVYSGFMVGNARTSRML